MSLASDNKLNNHIKWNLNKSKTLKNDMRVINYRKSY